MFEFLRQMSVPKLSAAVIRWMFYCARFFGMLCFRLKSPSDDDQVVMVQYGRWWKWFLAIFRVGCVGIQSCSYLRFILTVSDLLPAFLHIVRVLINIACSMSLLRLHLYQGTECTLLVNRFLQLLQRVRSLCRRKPFGFGGAHELAILIILLLFLTNDGTFEAYKLLVRYPKWFLILSWIADCHISISTKFLLYFAVLGYLTLGLLYADLNDYVRTELRSQLESLDDRSSPRKLRKARQNLDKCLALYKDLQSVTALLQRIYDLPLLLGLTRNCVNASLISYHTFILYEFGLFWHWFLISIEILGILLLTLSVQRALLQFGVIHRLMPENSYISEDKEWHTTLEVFYTHLNLYELRVRPLGLFNISNELLVVFLSALVTYITVIIQYGMQIEAISSSLSNRLSYSPA